MSTQADPREAALPHFQAIVELSEKGVGARDDDPRFDEAMGKILKLLGTPTENPDAKFTHGMLLCEWEEFASWARGELGYVYSCIGGVWAWRKEGDLRAFPI